MCPKDSCPCTPSREMTPAEQRHNQIVGGVLMAATSGSIILFASNVFFDWVSARSFVNFMDSAFVVFMNVAPWVILGSMSVCFLMSCWMIVDGIRMKKD